MRTIVKFSMVIFFIICVLSCANKEETLDGISRAIYDSSNHAQEMKREPGPSSPPDHKPPKYDQYKKERQKILGRFYKDPLMERRLAVYTPV